MRSLGFTLLLVLALIPARLVGDDDRHSRDSNRDFHWWDTQFERNPAIGLTYGVTKPSYKDFREALADLGWIEAKIGGVWESLSDSAAHIIHFDANFLTLTRMKADFKSKTPNGLRTDVWRLSLSRERGYGYRLGEAERSASISLVHSSAFTWSQLKADSGPADSIDNLRFDRFRNTFRFGTSTTAGVRVHVVPALLLEANYERAIVFPRHMFWRWLGSAVIEEGAQAAVDGFVNRVKKSTPTAAPIIAFVLKNAISYGIYELRKSNMNWPFTTEAPFLFDTFSVGVTFVF